MIMKVGILSKWNATCGVSLHAELLAWEFIKMGLDVRIFAPYIRTANRWWHHRIIKEDEPFVTRCYSELRPRDFSGGSLEFDKIVKEKFDLFIVESYTSIPYSEVEKLIEKLDCFKVVVIHEGSRADIRYANLRVFDSIVVFDERYINEMLPEYYDIARIISYPCHLVEKGSRKFAEDRLTFFSFGRQPVVEYADYIEALEWLSKKYDFVYKIVRSDGFLPFDKPWIEQSNGRIPNSELYSYLHSADIHLLPKGNTSYVVVSSTLCQCLGSLVPTVVPNTRHFEKVDKEAVVIYKNVEELKEKLVELIENENLRRRIAKAAERYVEKNRVDRIARMFLDLYRDRTLLHSVAVQ